MNFRYGTCFSKYIQPCFLLQAAGNGGEDVEEGDEEGDDNRVEEDFELEDNVKVKDKRVLLIFK